MNRAFGPRGPRGRGRRLIQPLRVAAAVAMATALAGAAGIDAGAAIAIGVCVLAPVARLAFLTARWWQIGDVRFARWGVALLIVLAGAPVVGRLT